MFFQQEISYYNPNTPDTYCTSIIFIQNQVFIVFLKIIGAQNQLPIPFCPDFIRN